MDTDTKVVRRRRRLPSSKPAMTHVSLRVPRDVRARFVELAGEGNYTALMRTVLSDYAQRA
jgi:hypothetical protein